MSLKKASGKSELDPIIQLANIYIGNPWLELGLLNKSNMKEGRSLIERQIISLAERIGPEKLYTLAEVTDLLCKTVQNKANEERLLVAPPEIIDYIPPGKRVDTILNYLEGVISKAEREVLLLTPFWDISTLTNLLRCTSFRGTKPELVLLLVHMGKQMPHVQKIVDSISSIWLGIRIRIYLHVVKPNDQVSYPHAKCLIVDRCYGYLGSANFTEPGMKGHFELGVSLSLETSRTLGDLLQHLWSQTNIFTLAWDTAPFSDPSH